MSKIKKHKSPYAFFVADFETTKHKEFSSEQILAENQVIDSQELSFDFTPNKTSQVFLCGLKSVDTNTYYLSYENIYELFDNIVYHCCHFIRKRKAICYFHNLKYDGSYILRWLIKHGYQQTLRVNKYNQEDINRREFSLLVSNGKWFKLSMWWRGILITFLDSLKLLPQSLNELGQDLLGMEKIKDIPYSDFYLDKKHQYPKLWLDYLFRDVDILKRVLEKWFLLNKFSMRQMTIGSIAYKNIKNIINNRIPNFSIKDYNYFINWFHGGLTFPSFKYWGKWVYLKKKIKLIDSNSMYPSCMCDYLPFGTPQDKPLNEWEHYVSFHIVKIKSAIIKEKYNDIGAIWKPFNRVINNVLESKKLIHITNILPHYQYLQEVKNEIYYLCDKELAMWEKLYDMKYIIVKTHYFQADKYLEPTILQLYEKKVEAKKHYNATKYLLCKLVLNNLFGKTGQAPIRKQTFYGNKESIDKFKYQITTTKKGIYGGYEIVPIKYEDDKANPIFLAVYITSLARVSLLTQYIELVNQGGTFLYCDTDSIIFIDSEKGVSFKNIDDVKLHHWSFDITDADAFCSLCPKQYRIVKNKEIIKSASAGIKKEDIDKVPHVDYNYDCGAKYHLNKTTLKDSELGKVIYDSPFNFLKWKKIKKNPICPKELK